MKKIPATIFIFFLFVFIGCSVKKNIITKSYVVYNDNILILYLYRNELPPKIKKWDRFPHEVYLELDNKGINTYDKSTKNYTYLFNNDEIDIKCNDVLFMPDTVVLKLGRERLKVYLNNNNMITGFEHINPPFFH